MRDWKLILSAGSLLVLAGCTSPTARKALEARRLRESRGMPFRLLRPRRPRLHLRPVAPPLGAPKPRRNPAPAEQPMMPGKNGGRLKRGGVNPNSGRPKTTTFAAFIRELHAKEDVRSAIEEAAKNADSKGFSPVLKLMAEYDPERPAPPKQELSGEVIVRVVRD
jgi:hypothetical protein